MKRVTPLVFVLLSFLFSTYFECSFAQCNGSIITINGNSTPFTTPVTLVVPLNSSAVYQWYNNNYLIENANWFFYDAPGAGVYTCKITTVACGTVPSTNSITLNGPGAIVSEFGSALCEGGVANLLAYGGSSYQWNLDGIPINGAVFPSYAPLVTGNYSCSATDLQCGTTTSNSIFMTIGNIPNVNLLAPKNSVGSVNSYATDVCAVSSNTILITTPPNLGNYELFNTNNLNASVNFNTTGAFASPGTGNYFVKLNSFSFCGGQTNTVAVRDINSHHKIVSSGLTTFCNTVTPPLLYVVPFDPNNLSTTNYGANPGPVWESYQWKRNGVVIPNGVDPSVLQPTQSGWYSCRVTNTCGTAMNIDSLLITVTTQLPAANITPSGNVVICSNQQLVLNATTGTNYTYQWKKNGVSYGTAGSSLYIFGWNGNPSGSYSVVVTNGAGCSATSSPVVLSLVTAPVSTITPSGPTTVCSGSVVLNANTGTGFTYQWKNSAVNIAGATAASYPAATSGIYSLEVTATSGCSATSSPVLVSIGAASPSTITPSGPTTICSGSVFLNANTGTGLTYQWKNNGTNITGATGSSFTATSSGSYTVVVTATGGCSATSTTTVVTIGALTASVTPGGTVTVCSGTSTTLSATAGTGYTYQWYRNNVVLSAATAATFTTSTAGTYKCVVSSGSCTATTNSVVVSVTNNPTPAVSYSTPLSFCSPGSVLLSGNSYAGVSYQWENNSVAIGGATAQNYTATTAGQYRVKQTANGCVKYSGKVTVSTATAPTATITASGSTTLCTSGTVAMSVSSPVPGYTYQWKKNNVNIAGATGTSYGATSTGNYTVAATASCGTGISNAIAVNIGSFTAQVIPSGTATLCTGSSLMLSANTGTGFTYQWKNNNVNISGATGSTYSVTTAGSYTVFMTSPCGNATSAATVVTQSTVTASVTPAGSSTVCSGSSIMLTANAGTGYTYRWYRNNVLLAPTTQTFTTSTAGSYKVEVSISGSCATQSNTAVITVINNATPTVTAGGPTTFCAGQSVTFTANTYAGVTQQWQKNSVNIAGATNQTYTATTGGNYRVQQTANGCTKNSAQNAVTVNCRVGDDGVEISSDEAGTAIQMNVYPNPFEDILTIELNSDQKEPVQMIITDILGQVRYKGTITVPNRNEIKPMLAAGVYLLTVKFNNKSKSMRIVKAKN